MGGAIRLGEIDTYCDAVQFAPDARVEIPFCWADAQDHRAFAMELLRKADQLDAVRATQLASARIR